MYLHLCKAKLFGKISNIYEKCPLKYSVEKYEFYTAYINTVTIIISRTVSNYWEQLCSNVAQQI